MLSEKTIMQILKNLGHTAVIGLLPLIALYFTQAHSWDSVTLGQVVGWGLSFLYAHKIVNPPTV